LYSAKRYEEALASYNKALDIDSENANAWYNRGLTLGQLKSDEEALASYENEKGVAHWIN